MADRMLTKAKTNRIMMVWFFAFLCFAVIAATVLGTAGVVHANTASVIDDADLYTEAEELTLEAQCSYFYQETGTHLLVMTIDAGQLTKTDDHSTEAYIEDYGDAAYPGESYIGLILNMNTRYYYVDVAGTDALGRITDAEVETILDELFPSMRDGDYYETATTFVTRSAHWYNEGGYDSAAGLKRLISPLGFLVSLISALLIAFLWYGIVAKKHHEKKTADNADLYTENGALQLTVNSDRFVRQYVTRVPKAQSNNSGHGGGSTHRSSSGSSHRGGGRHF